MTQRARTAGGILPTLKAKMDECNIASLRDLYEAVKHFIPKADELAPKDSVPTYKRFVCIATGITSGWNSYFGGASHEAAAIATYFSCSLESLFGEKPKTLVTVYDEAHPYNRDVHEKFLKAMTQAGYKNITDLYENLFLPDLNIQTLYRLSRGEGGVFGTNGDYSPLAQEVASLFDCSTDYLFGAPETGYTPPETTGHNQDCGLIAEKLATIFAESLTPRQVDILLLHHVEGYPLEDISKKYQVSMERTRRIEIDAVKKLIAEHGVTLWSLFNHGAVGEDFHPYAPQTDAGFFVRRPLKPSPT